jgi:hypothetical protein
VTASLTCPGCGAPRWEQADVCPSCGLTFDTAGPVAMQPTWGPPVSASSRGRPKSSNRIVLILIALAVLGGGYYLLNRRETTAMPTVTADSAPAPGAISFGTSVDRSTFALTGQGATFPVSQDVAGVARLSRASRGEELTIRLAGDGKHGTIAAGQIPSPTEVVAISISGTFLPNQGNVIVEILDADGNVLASGKFVTL